MFIELTAIHKPLDEDNKVVSFAKVLGSKYKNLRIIMWGKPPYQFANALRGFDMSGKDGKKDHVDQAMAFQAQRTQGSFGRGRRNFYRGRGEGRGRGFSFKQNNQNQIGVTKRKHKYVVDTGLNANIPMCLWVEAIMIAIFVITSNAAFEN